jgi:hypothetical protein
MAGCAPHHDADEHDYIRDTHGREIPRGARIKIGHGRLRYLAQKTGMRYRETCYPEQSPFGESGNPRCQPGVSPFMELSHQPPHHEIRRGAVGHIASGRASL